MKTAKPLLGLIAFSSLMISACTDEVFSTAATQDDDDEAGDTPFVVVEDEVATPIDEGELTPIVPPADGGQVPVLPGNGDAGGAADLINAASGSVADNFWLCSDSEEAGEQSALAFFADGTGLLGVGEQVEQISWNSDGVSIDLYYESSFYAQLADIQVSAGGQSFTTLYAVHDGSTGTLSCALTYFDDVDAGNEDEPAVTPVTPVGPDDTPLDDDVASGSAAHLLNTFSNGELIDAWFCHSSFGDEFALAFLSQGSGLLVDVVSYPDGIEHRWALQGSNLVMTLTDGNQVMMQDVYIEADYLYADALILNGASSGAVECMRETL